MTKKAKKAIIKNFSNEFPIVFFVQSGQTSYPLGDYILLRSGMEFERKLTAERVLGIDTGVDL